MLKNIIHNFYKKTDDELEFQFAREAISVKFLPFLNETKLRANPWMGHGYQVYEADQDGKETGWFNWTNLLLNLLHVRVVGAFVLTVFLVLVFMVIEAVLGV